MVASPLAERRRAERRSSGVAGLEGRMRTLSPLGNKPSSPIARFFSARVGMPRSMDAR